MDIDLNKWIKVIQGYSSTKNEILAVYLFGSILETTDFTQIEDIDIAFLLEGDESVNTFEKTIELNAELSQLLNFDKFDIVILNDAPLPFRYDIITQGKLLYSKNDELRRDFESLSTKKYFKFKPYLEHYDKYMESRLTREEGENMFNKEIVFQRANMSESALKKLTKLQSLPETIFLTDAQNIALAEHYLRISIDSLVDLATHIIAVKGLGRPGTSKDIVNYLTQAEVIPQDFVKPTLRLIKLRDRLIHLYWEVESPEIYDVVQKELTNISKFLTYLLKYVEKESSPQEEIKIEEAQM
ncbi:MAG: HepT-like ribonuclease domain-containing protein [bacterium]